MDLITALKYEGRFSPSENFKLFLDGLVSVVSSGGNITAYLKSKTDQYKTLASYEQKRFLEILGILAEVYVTVFVVGPVFLMTILVVLGFLASDSLFILYILVYILIPAGTLLFIIFLSTISNELTSSKMRVTSEIMDEFDDVSISSVTAYDLGMLKQITRNYRLLQIKRTLLDPLTLMRAHPHYSFAITVPASLVYLFYSVRGYEDLILQSSFNPLNLQYMNLQAVSLLDDHLIYAFLIVALPFVAFYESHARWLRMVEGDLPDFLKRLASINEAGILLVDAIALVSKSKIGVLHTEVKKMVEYISWGSSLVEVLWKFEYRIRTDINSRIITLIIKASESTSDVISVLNIASSEADMENRLKKERSAEMLVYVFIVYISFLVFLFIVYVLAAYFVPALPEDLEGVGSGISINFGFDSEAFTLLFFHASLIQGFCSGLVAGKMGTGSIYSGVKHSVFMVLIAYVVFTLFI
jgi:flagellar protein FlaJ